ncbi:sodium:calcium antiporter [Candidatus Bipolaricaulota bacterium]|nr:sodium:calcium antiporter [Candidatus Bipolaricaulota bacterium]MCK4598364.1 sodium:calcium antiporter [Candidatus Bipolaricaulota bacterium]
MTIHWITFFLASLAIIIAGVKLASFGEALGKRTGIGQGWIGLLFLATITSIPELTTTVTGATINAPNIAVGNALGSNMFNVAIVAVMDILLLGRGPFLVKVRSYHMISGGFAILLTTLVILGIAVDPGVEILGLSPISLIILLTYLFGIFILYRVEKREGVTELAEAGTMSLVRAVGGFLICAAVIITAGVFLIHASKAISVETGLSASFMGAILVAVVTSLPELSTSIGALKIGAYDMILGNLFGSNMFNILTVFVADVAFRRGAILARLGIGKDDQLIVASLGIGLTAIAIIAIGYRSRRRVLGMGVDAALLLTAYLLGTYLIIYRGINI